MKYLSFFFVILLSSELGYSQDSEDITISSSESSGVICQIDEEGRTLECDENNSLLPDVLKTNAAVQTNEYTCIDITYRTGIVFKKSERLLQCAYQLKEQRLCTVLAANNVVPKCVESTPGPKPLPSSTTPETPSGLYCIVDNADNTVECMKRNSQLPNDLDDGNHRKSNEYVCIDITYKTGMFLYRQSYQVRQCALKLMDQDLCDVLNKKNMISSCYLSTPYSSPTVSPPSNMYCEVGAEGNKVECTKANSLLPSDLDVASAKNSQNYVCLSVTYKTGIIPFKKTRSTQQCALELKEEKDLCRVLRVFNNIQKCKFWNPNIVLNEPALNIEHFSWKGNQSRIIALPSK